MHFSSRSNRKHSSHALPRLRSRRPGGNGRRLRFEGLEDRRLLSATTAPMLLVDLNAVSMEPDTGLEGTYSSEPIFGNAFDGEVFFSTNGDPRVEFNPLNILWWPGGLWKTDGTATGTVRVDELAHPDDFGLIPSSQVIGFNNELYVGGSYYDFNGIGQPGLWKIDDTTGEMMLMKDSGVHTLIVCNGELYFTANDGESGNKLWKTDGTIQNTVQVAGVSLSPGSSSSKGLAVFNNELYFGADDGQTGLEVWKTNGTANGTVRVKDINLNGDSDPGSFEVFNNELYFGADNGQIGWELWKTNGTMDGTVLVKDINPVGDSRFQHATIFNNELYFSATDGATGTELWKSDGTLGGTLRVKDIASGAASSSPLELTPFNNELYFRANIGASGSELWKTDGTVDGTVRVIDAGIGLTVFQNELYFERGGELWKTDGTELNTEQLTFLTSNPWTDRPNGVSVPLIATDDFLVFAANDGVYGVEPWVIRVVAPEVTPENLAQVIDDLPSGTTEVVAAATPSNLNDFFTAIAALPANSGDVIDIVLSLAEGDYEGAVIDVPAGYLLIISGDSGEVVFHGASPALTLQSGNMRVTNVTFVNSTDSPSIVVNGGSLAVRNSFIQETTGGAQAAVAIAGGSLDLGTFADPGGNTIEVSGQGEFLRNLTGSSVPAIGNQYQNDGVPLTSEIISVPEWMRLVIDESGSSVNLVGAYSLTVIVDDATWEIGTPLPDFTVSYDGFVHGDDQSVLESQLHFVTDAGETSTVGSYAVAANGQSSNKYDITYVDGTLTVTPAIVAIDLRPASLNVNQNGAISLVIFGSSSFDVSQITLRSLNFAGVSIDVFSHTLFDADQDGRADLLLHFHSSVALKEALTELYSDLLLEDFEEDGEYTSRQETLLALDGAFGEYDQEFEGSDTTTLFLAGNSLRSLLDYLDIST